MLRISKAPFKRSLLLSTTLLFFITGCNEQEFFEKEYLDGAGVPDDPITNTGGGTGGGGTGGGGTGGGNPGICGNGTLENTSDTFTQNTAQEGKVDILWVIDDSGSMGDEQNALAYNFNAFIQNFITRNVDFKMAITTTDGRSGRSGQMIGDPALLTSTAAAADEAAFLNNFSNLIRVGTSGSGNEVGLQTSGDFMTQHSSTFLRDDAYLVVVYVSDEEDHSSSTVSSYVDGLKALKTNEGLVKVYSIVTKELVPNKQWETLGTRYIEAAALTGGTSSDIHDDFYNTLSDMGGQILNLLDSFPLSGVPATANISISVDGVQQNTGWAYDSVARVITFDANTIPNAGSITVAYYEHCVGAP